MIRKIIFVLLVFLLVSCDWSEKSSTSSNKEEKIKLNEKKKIKKYSSIVKRENDTLLLILDDGKVKKLKDNKDPQNVGKWILYVFKNYFPSVKYFLIQARYYEGGSYLFYSKVDGSMSPVDDVPIMSPDKNYFITVDVCDAYCSGELEIWRVTKKGMVKEWSMNPDEYWGDGKAEWIGKHLVKITKSVKKDPDDARTAFIDKYFYVQKRSNTWEVMNKLEDTK